MDNIRQRLRAYGGELHHQVDEAFSAFTLDSAAGYQQFLQAHGAALFSLEHALEHAGVEHLLTDWPARRRRDALRADLLALGCPVPTSLPVAAPTTAGWCWGAAYVLEGSRLGGQVLLRRLRAAQPEAPANYLGHAAEPGLWPGFLQQLEAGAMGIDEHELQRGVDDAFGLFLRAAEQQAAAGQTLELA